MDARRTVQHHVDDAHPDDLRHARAGVVQQAQQQVVAARSPIDLTAESNLLLFGRSERAFSSLSVFLEQASLTHLLQGLCPS
jgi:hypothetical protein